MRSSKPITIVGLGQAGGILSYKLLEKGHSIRVIDARSKTNMECNTSVQTPWGWYRKFSLQSSLKKNLMSPDFPIPHIDDQINTTNGPMLITSKTNKVLPKWQEWISNNPETDGKILTPKEADTLFNLPEDYFENRGGVFVCDTRDKLIDFGKMNHYIWDYLEDHPNCEFIDNCRISSIKTNNNRAEKLITNQGSIAIDKTILSIGNQTSKLLEEIPIVQIRLPYMIGSDTQHLYHTNKYISIWNKDSSLLLYKNGDIKLACGVQSIFDYKKTNLNHLPHFISMGLQGITNLNLCMINENLIEKAEKELLKQNIEINLENYQLKYCNVDLTPNLCPYIYFPKKHSNILSISGFSGSGSMILDNNLSNIIIDSVIQGKLDDSLNEFSPYQSIFQNWFPPKNKQTPLSSII